MGIQNRRPFIFFASCWWALFFSVSACDSKESTETIPHVQFRSSNSFPNQNGVQYKKRYTFTQNMFSRRSHLFLQAMGKYRGKPDTHYLEIGVHEGRSFFWVLENIMTHPTSTLTAIDLFDTGQGTFKPTETYGDHREFKRTFFNNVKRSGQQNRIRSRVGYSQQELQHFSPNTFDIIYIDGCHSEACAREDAQLCWPLLKEGGRLLFDDYSARDYPGVYKAANELYRNHKASMDVIHTGRVLVLEKKSSSGTK